jgi:hypothetical protein
MSTRCVHLPEQPDKDDERLTLLRRLATIGFDQIDQGHGIELSDEQLAARIERIGRRAASA